MKYLDLTLPTPAENLACDEALLAACDADSQQEVLRVWEAQETFVVLGYANRAAIEVNLPACDRLAVPVLRRTSGGGAIVQGAGCLNYSLVLAAGPHGALASVTETTAFVLERHRAALSRFLGATVEMCGTSDLALDGKKFSGNAQRRGRRAALVHGTFLLGMDVSLMDALLRHPSREPDYRASRRHADFVRNISATADAVKSALRDVWDARDETRDIPREAIAQLLHERYSRTDWNLRY